MKGLKGGRERERERTSNTNKLNTDVKKAKMYGFERRIDLFGIKRIGERDFGQNLRPLLKVSQTKLTIRVERVKKGNRKGEEGEELCRRNDQGSLE